MQFSKLYASSSLFCLMFRGISNTHCSATPPHWAVLLPGARNLSGAFTLTGVKHRWYARAQLTCLLKIQQTKALHTPEWTCKSSPAISCPCNCNGKDASSVIREGKQRAQLLQAPEAGEESAGKGITRFVFRVNLSGMEPLPCVANCEIGSQEGSKCVGSAALSSRLEPILVQGGWGSAVSFLSSFQNSPASYSLGQREILTLTLLQVFYVLI